MEETKILPIYNEPDTLLSANDVQKIIDETVLISPQEQQRLIEQGDMTKLVKVLGACNAQIAQRYQISPRDIGEIRKFLDEAVLYAATLYRDRHIFVQKHHAFAIYYTWYTIQILESYRHGGFEESRVWHDTVLGNFLQTSVPVTR